MTDRTIVEIPLEVIVDHPDQPRYGEGDVDALAASILEVGQLEPIIVLSTDTSEAAHAEVIVLAGHRRTAALRKLGRQTANAIVLEGVDREDAVKAIMASNTAREALTPLEEARGYQTMLNLGVKAEMVARISGTKKKRVEGLAGAAIALGDHVAGLAGVQLTVEEMEALARHAGNKTAYKKLIAELGKPGFEWAARTADNAKHKAEIKAAAKAIIAAVGVELVKENELRYGSDGLELQYLVDADGNAIDVDEHNHSCPGACAAISGWASDVEDAVAWGCRSWEEHGHKRFHGGREYVPSPEEIARREEDERVQEAWRLAGDLRHEFARSLIEPKTIDGMLLTALVPLAWGSGNAWRRAAELLGWGETDEWKPKPGQHAPHAFAALGLAAGEARVGPFVYQVPYYPEDREAAVAYLLLLESHSYTLHEPEVDFITRCEAADKAEDDDEEQPTPECGADSCAGCEETTCGKDEIAEQVDEQLEPEDAVYPVDDLAGPLEDLTDGELIERFFRLEALLDRGEGSTVDDDDFNAASIELGNRGYDTSDRDDLRQLLNDLAVLDGLDATAGSQAG